VSESEGGEKGMEKGLEKVKHLGNFLFSTIKGAGQKIKDTVSANACYCITTITNVD